MPDTGFEPTMAMALAATVVNKKAMTKTIRSAMIVWNQLCNTPNWKKNNVAASTAMITERITFIEISFCVRGSSVATFLPLNSLTARPKALLMMPAWRMMPMSPAMAMPPMPRGRPISRKMPSGVANASWLMPMPSSMAGSSAASNSERIGVTNGITTNHTRAEPPAMIRAYFRPMIYPRPSTAAEVLRPKVSFAFAASHLPQPHICVESDDDHAPKVDTTKS